MGQQHPKHPKANKKLQKNIALNRDPRLIETTVFIPELFQGIYNQEIKKIERLISHLPDHPLLMPLIDGIDDRFKIVK